MVITLFFGGDGGIVSSSALPSSQSNSSSENKTSLLKMIGKCISEMTQTNRLNSGKSRTKQTKI